MAIASTGGTWINLASLTPAQVAICWRPGVRLTSIPPGEGLISLALRPSLMNGLRQAIRGLVFAVSRIGTDVE